MSFRVLCLFMTVNLISCQTIPRLPSSANTKQMPYSMAKLYEELLTQPNGIKTLQEKSALANTQQLTSDTPDIYDGKMDQPWGYKKEEFTIHDLNGYERKDPSSRFFYMGNDNVGSYELLLKHKIFFNDPTPAPIPQKKIHLQRETDIFRQRSNVMARFH